MTNMFSSGAKHQGKYSAFTSQPHEAGTAMAPVFQVSKLRFGTCTSHVSGK